MVTLYSSLLRFKLLVITVSLMVLLSGCRPAPPAYQAEKSEVFSRAAIAGPHSLATEIGKDVMLKGGNAIDAAVAVQFAMAVCYPRAGNLGGGGFLVYRSADGTKTSLDYRERAPAAATRDMYLDEKGDVKPDVSTRGHLAVGVPGTVAGIRAMYDRYGSLSWTELVQPAIELAQYGYKISTAEADRLNGYMPDFREFNEVSPFIQDTFLPGQIIKQFELAATLRLIQENGVDGFYKGKTADLLVAEMQSGGGLITKKDLADYEVSWRKPVQKTVDNLNVISMPPSSSGGVALAQMLGMVKPYELAEMGFQSTAATHLMVEAERRAYADRAEYLGDSDFADVPVDELISTEYLTERMSDFSRNNAGTSESVLAGEVDTRESFETTHISIVDTFGNAVSITTTLNGNFGSKVIVDGAGFFLNNEMDDFSSKPGVPNMFGLVGAEANAIAPGKRMLSSMTPTIVEKEGKLFMVLGAPGGSTIITAVYQTLLNVTEFNMPLDSAIRAPRFHHQWLPDQILVEEAALSPAVRAELTAMGHNFREVKRMAVVKAVQVMSDGKLHAAGDPRNPDDDVAGF